MADSLQPQCTAACQASLFLTISRSLPKFMSIASLMPTSHFILWCPLFLLPSIFLSIRVFSSESALRIRRPKYWCQHQSFQWVFRVDFHLRLVWSPCIPGDSQESSPAPQFKSINSSVLHLHYSPALTTVQPMGCICLLLGRWPLCMLFKSEAGTLTPETSTSVLGWTPQTYNACTCPALRIVERTQSKQQTHQWFNQCGGLHVWSKFPEWHPIACNGHMKDMMAVFAPGGKWCSAGEITVIRSDQIRSVTQSCPTRCDSMNRSTPGLPVHHQLPEFTHTHVHRVSDAIQPSRGTDTRWAH